MRIPRTLLVVMSLIAMLSAGASAPQGAPTAAPATAPATEYAIDAVHSTALFRVQHLGAGRFYGRFNEVTGSIRFRQGREMDLALNVSIAVESVDTGNGQLDGHLKSPDFFNAREFPAMTFNSKTAKRISGGVYGVKGELTIHGVTKTMVAEVEFAGAADLGRGARCGFETKFTIKRSDFGMTYGVENGMLGDETMVIVSMEGVAS